MDSHRLPALRGLRNLVELLAVEEGRDADLAVLGQRSGRLDRDHRLRCGPVREARAGCCLADADRAPRRNASSAMHLSIRGDVCPSPAGAAENPGDRFWLSWSRQVI